MSLILAIAVAWVVVAVAWVVVAVAWVVVVAVWVVVVGIAHDKDASQFETSSTACL